MQKSLSRAKQREKQNKTTQILSSLLLRSAKHSAVSWLPWQQMDFPGSENQNILDFFHKGSLVYWPHWDKWLCPNVDSQGGEWRCHLAVDPGDLFQEYHLRGFSQMVACEFPSYLGTCYFFLYGWAHSYYEEHRFRPVSLFKNFVSYSSWKAFALRTSSLRSAWNQLGTIPAVLVRSFSLWV